MATPFSPLDSGGRPAPLRLHGWCVSPYTHKIVMALVHTRIDYQWVPAPLTSRRRLAAKTGAAKIPVLQAGEEWISDSTRILQWLDRRFPDRAIYPSDPRRRLACILIEDWADEALVIGAHVAVWCEPASAAALISRSVSDNPVLETRVGGRVFRRLGPRLFRGLALKHHGSVANTERIFASQLDTVEAMLAGQPYLCGEAPSAADFAVAGQLVNFIGQPASRFLDARPALSRMVTSLARLLPARSGITEASGDQPGSS